MTVPEVKPDKTIEKPSGSMVDQIARFKKDQAEKVEAQAAKDLEKKPEVKEPEIKDADPDANAGKPSDEPKVEPTDGSKEEEIKAPEKPKFRFVNTEGEEVPFPIKVDGKDIEVSEIDKLTTYAQQGYHSNTRNEEIKKREQELTDKEQGLVDKEAELQRGADMLAQALQMKEGPAAKEKEPEGDDDDDLVDPDVKELRKDMKVLREQIKRQDEMLLGKLVEEAKADLDGNIEEAIKEFPYAKGKEKQMYVLLAETNKKTKMPTYTAREAAKIVHDSANSDFKSWLKEHPDVTKLQESEKEHIVADYLKQKEENGAPVASPSTVPVKTDGGEKEDKGGDIAYQIARFAKNQRAKRKAGANT